MKRLTSTDVASAGKQLVEFAQPLLKRTVKDAVREVLQEEGVAGAGDGGSAGGAEPSEITEHATTTGGSEHATATGGSEHATATGGTNRAAATGGSEHATTTGGSDSAGDAGESERAADDGTAQADQSSGGRSVGTVLVLLLALVAAGYVVRRKASDEGVTDPIQSAES